MVTNVTFAKKVHRESWTDQNKVTFEYGNCNIAISWMADTVTVQVAGGNDSKHDEITRGLWEMCFLYDGYFYKLESYSNDDCEQPLERLGCLDFYRSSVDVLRSAAPLCKSNREINARTFTTYMGLREGPRTNTTMWRELIHAFYYLCSDAYSKNLVDHRLSLLLNVCDGIHLNSCGNKGNVESGIKYVLSQVDIKLAKEGSEYLGVNKSSAYETLAAVRNELDHYIPKRASLGNQILEGKSTNAIYLYFEYVLRVALRATLLEQVGAAVDRNAVTVALQHIVDWAIISSDADAKCYLPVNELRRSLINRNNG